MKKLFLFVILLNICPGVYAQVNFQDFYDHGSYNFNTTFKLETDDMFTTYKSQFGLTNDDIMVLDNEYDMNEDELGGLQSSYKQFYKDYEVEGKRLNVLSKCGVVLSISGSVLKDLDMDVTDPILEEYALDSALAYVNSPIGYIWEDSTIENG